MNNDKLAEFLSKHKYNSENFNEEGNYDPSPYWLADEIVEFLDLQNVSQRSELLLFRKWQKANWKDVYLMSDEFMIETYLKSNCG